MKRAAKLVVLFFLSMLSAEFVHSQQNDAPAEGGDEMSRAFGKGNGVRGTVTAAEAHSFMIRTDEGISYRVFWSENTRLMKDRQPIEASEIHLGDMLVAGGIVDAKAKTVGAVLLLDIDAKQVQEARAAFGKTWLAGKVTDIHELKITVERADDKRLLIVSVDENTSFKRRREDVTLSDIKVGDFITAQGALHDNSFLASTLRVVPPKEGGGARAPVAPAPSVH